MEYLYLVLATIGNSAQSILQKEYNKRFYTISKSGFLYNFAMTFMAFVVFLVAFLCNMEVNGYSVIYALIFAFCFQFAIIFSFLAIRHGPLALTALVLSFSLIIPMVYGMAFLHEPISTVGIVGLVLLFLSLILVNDYSKKNDGKKISKKYIIYLILMFVGNGCGSLTQKMHQINYEGKYGNFFMMIAMAFAMTFNLVMLLIYRPKNERGLYFKGSAFSGATGLLNGLCNLVVVYLATRLSTTIVYPTICAGSIFITFLIAVFVYKERFKVYQYIGYIIGITAVVLVNIV